MNLRVFSFYGKISLLLILVAYFAHAQERSPLNEKPNVQVEAYEPTINDYLQWTEHHPVYEPIDTALTIQSFYEKNYTLKDQFGNWAFPNLGQTWMPLTLSNKPQTYHGLLPTGKSFNYTHTEDVKYYDVKTPTTNFNFENGSKEGNILSSMFSHSPSEQINYTIQYHGLRSLGKYRSELASNNALILSAKYRSKNNRLNLWGHYATQNIDNQENGGLADIDQFIDAESEFNNRQNVSVNLAGTDTELDNRRVHIVGTYGVFSKLNQDSIKYYPLRIQNKFTFDKQWYTYEETSDNTLFGGTDDVFSGFERKNVKNLHRITNRSTAIFQWADHLLLEGGVQWENMNYFFDNELNQGLVFVPKELKTNLFSIVGNLKVDVNDNIKLDADASYGTGDDFQNIYHLDANLTFEPIKDYALSAKAAISSEIPSFNLLMNQSFYKDFNYNNLGFDNVNRQILSGTLEAKPFKTKLSAQIQNIENYVYVAADGRPRQIEGSLSYYAADVQNHFQYKNWNLTTRLLYQQVTQGEETLPLPDFVGRATLYYQGKVFNDKAEMQAGVNVEYFTKFKARAFFPIINEFRLNSGNQPEEIGDYPVLDIFFNLKVKRMRIYIRGLHINELFKSQNDFFSAPGVPFRDFKVQLGANWFIFT